MPVRIAIVHNQPHTSADAGWLVRSNGSEDATLRGLHQTAGLGVLGQVESIRESLAGAGHDAVTFAAGDAGELWGFLSRHRPELVFNCCEALADRAALEMNVAALYELLAIPYTGSPALTLGLALNKPLTKAVLSAHGIQTPAYIALEPGRDPMSACRLSFPLIVKPAAEDASIGIDDGAVVNDERALAERVRFVWREFRQAALVEEFIAGREFNISILATSPNELTTLPIGEIVFDTLPENRPHIVGYEAKWNAAAAFRQVKAARCPAVLEDETAERFRRVALDAARACGIRDYGRVEIRLRERDHAIFVLEVNPNPDLSDECEFLRAARASGRTNQGTICEIVERAIEREQSGTKT